MLDKNEKLINPEVRIETTNFCNANCVMCSHSTMKRSKGIMGNDTFRGLIIQAKELGAKLISPFGYGEPLIDLGLEDKIQMCTDMERDTFITTNGSLANKKRIDELFKAGLGHIRFSIHAINPVDYERIHKGLEWNETIKNLFDTIDLAMNYPDVKISISSIPMSGETVKEIQDTWEPLVDWLEIWKPHNWNNKNEYRKETTEKLKTCGRPFKGPVQIEWDGSVIPCCFLTDNELVMGNTNNDSIKDILEGKSYQDLRAKHESGNLKGLPCDHCDQLFNDEVPMLYSNRNMIGFSRGTTSSLKYNLL